MQLEEADIAGRSTKLVGALKAAMGVSHGRTNTAIETIRGLSLVEENGIMKSRIDQRVYKLVTLPNRLQVLLIHDDRLIISAAALTVKGNSSHQI